MNIKYIISSYINGYQPALIKLVGSLLKSGVSQSDIYTFVGGSENTAKLNWDYDINYYLVDHNSFDMTALIGVSNLKVDYDYVFLLHDTSWVGTNFMERVLNVVKSNVNSNKNIMLYKHGASMNIGMYSKNFIDSSHNEINTTYKNKPKEFYVTSEDKLIKKSKSPIYLNPTKFELIEPYDVYNTKTKRRVEYYSDIELYKAKANWKRGKYINTL